MTLPETDPLRTENFSTGKYRIKTVGSNCCVQRKAWFGLWLTKRFKDSLGWQKWWLPSEAERHLRRCINDDKQRSKPKYKYY